MSSALSAPHFHNEEAAYAYVEARIWPTGPVCPHCGTVERAGRLKGKTTRAGLWKCYGCRKPFTVKIGTIFEGSHVALNIWLQAMYLIAGSKKGISSNQLHRVLGVTLKTAWFMSHRIREAMRSDSGAMFGSDGGAVEIDETFIGRLKGKPVKAAFHHKMKVLGLIDRNTGKARTMVIDGVHSSHLMPIVLANVAREATIMTDEHWGYRPVRDYFAGHGTTAHKRGMKGVYQFCGERHLHRYLAEFEFRYNNRVALGCNDADRADELLQGIIGKRLTYQPASARH